MKKLHALIGLCILLNACNGQAPLSNAPAAQPLDVPQPTSLYTLPNASPKPKQISDYLPCILQDRKGNLWIGTAFDGLARYDGKTLTYFQQKEGYPGEGCRGMTEDGQGNLWFAMQHGVSRYDGHAFTNYTTQDGLPHNEAWCVLWDSKGRLWVGTMGGVARFNGKKFIPFPLPPSRVAHPVSQFTTDLVLCISEDKAGNIWFGTDGAGVCKWDGHSFTTFTQEEGLVDNDIWSIKQDLQGDIWMGAWRNGLSRYNPSAASGTNPFTNYLEKDGLSSNSILEIFNDRAGYLWFGTGGGGAMRYDGNTFTAFKADTSLTRNNVQTICEDRQGRLWFGLTGGLFRLEGDTLINITQEGPWPKFE